MLQLDLMHDFLSALGVSGLLEMNMCFGRERQYWQHLEPKGSCLLCGGQCSGHTCGTHEKGCFYVGRPRWQDDYWIFHPNCELYHG